MNNPKDLFSKIYDENVEKIYRFVFLKVSSQEVAEDLSSEVFLRGWQVFKENREEIENPSAFLYQIARNLIVDHYREKAKTQTVSAELTPIIDQSQNVEEKALIGSDMDKVRVVLADLKDDYRELIVWHYIDDYSVPEIAKMVNKPEGTVRVRLHRALMSLKSRLDVETS